MDKTNWSDCYKIRIREMTDAQTKHLIVKALIVQKLLIKYKSYRKYIRIYTEFSLEDNRICDIYFENLKTREIYIYEIQDKITKKWEDYTNKFYNNYEVFNFTTDLIVVDLKRLPDDLETLEEQVKELIM